MLYLLRRHDRRVMSSDRRCRRFGGLYDFVFGVYVFVQMVRKADFYESGCF